MKLNAKKFSWACAITAIILRILCGLLFMIMPMRMMGMSGYMMQGDFTEMQWQLSMHGFFFGLISWAIMSGVAGWLIATIYNKLLGDLRAQD